VSPDVEDPGSSTRCNQRRRTPVGRTAVAIADKIHGPLGRHRLLIVGDGAVAVVAIQRQFGGDHQVDDGRHPVLDLRKLGRADRRYFLGQDRVVFLQQLQPCSLELEVAVGQFRRLPVVQ
jgi:hypothetical protein